MQNLARRMLGFLVLRCAAALCLLVLASSRSAAENKDEQLIADLWALSQVCQKDKSDFSATERFKDELLKKYPSNAQRSRIYGKTAALYSSQGIIKHLGKIRPYVLEALKHEKDPVLRRRLYSSLGSCVECEVGPEKEVRRKTAMVYLQGYKELLPLRLPEKAPDLPGVPPIWVDSEDPKLVAAVEKKRRELLKAREEAEIIVELVGGRDVLIQQLTSMYERPPLDFDDLKTRATQILKDPRAVEDLLGKVVPAAKQEYDRVFGNTEVTRQLIDDLSALMAGCKGDTPDFEATERLKDELLTKYVSYPQRSRIYGQTAALYAGRGILKHVGKVRPYVLEALKHETNQVLRTDLYSCLGSCVACEAGPEKEVRRKAAMVYLQGYKELLPLRLPEKAPDFLTVPRIVEDGEDLELIAGGDRARRELSKGREEAEVIAELVAKRDVLIQQLTRMYSRAPLDFDDLKMRATQVLQDPSAVEDLLGKVLPEALREYQRVHGDEADSPDTPPVPEAATHVAWARFLTLGGSTVLLIAAILVFWWRRKRRGGSGPTAPAPG